MAVYGSSLQSIYGNSAAAVRANLKKFTFTFPNDQGVAQNVSIWVNRKNMYNRLVRVNDALCKLYASGGGYTLHSVGCFNWRLIRGSLARSMHSGAIALDINPAQNPMKYGALVTDMSAAFVACWTGNGFVWGGVWNRKDAMHFELASHTEPAIVPTTPPVVTPPVAPPVVTPPKPVVLPVLREGSKDVDHIKLLQRELNDHRGHYSLRERLRHGIWYVLGVDGDFGKNTRRALLCFQRCAGLFPDAVCGKNTWHAFGR
jgi:peptidoglycan hydrolase-like protein with peptidoglycan-binding domain